VRATGDGVVYLDGVVVGVLVNGALTCLADPPSCAVLIRNAQRQLARGNTARARALTQQAAAQGCFIPVDLAAACFPTLTSLTFSPSTVTGGGSSIGTVTLSAPAPPGGAIVFLFSGNPAVVMVPAQVIVPEGLTSKPFIATTSTVPISMDVTVGASYNGSIVQATLTVTP